MKASGSVTFRQSPKRAGESGIGKRFHGFERIRDDTGAMLGNLISSPQLLHVVGDLVNAYGV